MSDLTTLKRIVAAYQEDTARRQTTDGVHFYHVKQTNPNVNDIIKWLEDNEVASMEADIPERELPEPTNVRQVIRTIKAATNHYVKENKQHITYDGSRWAEVEIADPRVPDVIKHIEDNEAWYSIEPRTVTIEVSDG